MDNLLQFFTDQYLNAQQIGNQIIGSYIISDQSVDFYLVQTEQDYSLSLSSQLLKFQITIQKQRLEQHFLSIKQLFDDLLLDQTNNTQITKYSDISSATDYNFKVLSVSLLASEFPVSVAVEQSHNVLLFSNSNAQQNALCELTIHDFVQPNFCIYVSRDYCGSLTIKQSQDTYLFTVKNHELYPDCDAQLFKEADGEFVINLTSSRLEFPFVNYQLICDDGQPQASIYQFETEGERLSLSFDAQLEATAQKISTQQQEQTILEFAQGQEDFQQCALQIVSSVAVKLVSNNDFVRFNYCSQQFQEYKFPLGMSSICLLISNELNFNSTITIFQILENKATAEIGTILVTPNELDTRQMRVSQLRPISSQNIVVIRTSPYCQDFVLLIQPKERNLIKPINYSAVPSNAEKQSQSFMSSIISDIENMKELQVSDAQLLPELLEPDYQKQVYSVPDRIFFGYCQLSSSAYQCVRIYNSSIADLDFEIEIQELYYHHQDFQGNGFELIYNHQPVDQITTQLQQGTFTDVQIRFSNDSNRTPISICHLQIKSQCQTLLIPMLTVNCTMNIVIDSYLQDSIYIRNSGDAPARLFYEENKALLVLNPDSVQEIPIIQNQNFRNEIFVRLVEGSNGVGIWSDLLSKTGFVGFDFGDLLIEKFDVYLHDDY